MLLSIAYKSWRNLGLELVNLPFALSGGVLAIFFTGGWLTLGSLVGLVTLFGISTRNSIMMIFHYEYLVAVEKMTWGREVALRGAQGGCACLGQLYSVCWTASGSRSIMFNSTRAGFSGCRRPCSQFCSVAGLIPNCATNSPCDMPNLRRTFFTSTGLGTCTTWTRTVRFWPFANATAF